LQDVCIEDFIVDWW